MTEKRQFNRWCVEKDERAQIHCAGLDEEVKIVDISTGGMRIEYGKPLNLGEELFGEFKILPQLGTFFVKGRVARIIEQSDSWEISVVFDKVSSLPLHA